jgi:hypothetical protein
MVDKIVTPIFMTALVCTCTAILITGFIYHLAEEQYKEFKKTT